MKDLVKYHNDMNKISFNGFNEKELNLFFSLCFKAKDKGISEIVLTFSELRTLSNGDINLPRFLKTLKTTYDKLITAPFHYKTNNGFGAFILFNKYFVDEIEKTVTIKLSEDFSYMLNDLIGNFTKFDLLEFVNLKSSYSKNLFKLLKQWESKKSKEFEVNEFRILLSIPKTYRMSEIDKYILKPILEELPTYFYNLKVEKIKIGRKVTNLKFTWESKKQEIQEVEKVEIEISEKLNKSIQKAKKNRFIEKLLNNDNIELLINTFKENDLIRGLMWASKEIRRDISTINYLIKTIKTGAEKIEKRIIVKKDKQVEEIKEEVLEEIIEEKINITETEYEELYQTYLKLNNETHNLYVRKGFDLGNKNKYNIIQNLKEEEKIEIIEDTYNNYMLEEMNRLEVITGITEKDLLKKMAKIILDKKYVIVPFEFENPNHMSEFDKSIMRDCTLEARLRYTEKDHLNYLKNSNSAINFAELDRNLLLSKSGKLLTGGALEARLEKIAKDLKKVIFYKNKVIGNMWD